MPAIKFEDIQKNIESTRQDGSVMYCVFKCPVTGNKVESQATIQEGRGLADVAKKSVKRSLFWRLRYGVSSVVRSALGYGLAGRVAGDVAGAAVQGAMQKQGPSFSDDEKNAAVLQAFESVASRFNFDSKNGQWISSDAAADLMTDFAVQLNNAPVSQNYDRGVLAHMLVGVAMADGQLGDEEKAFLSGFMESSKVDSLASGPPVSGADLAEVSRGPVRDTMLMIAWGLACTDKDLAESEISRLSELAKGLGIEETRAQELKAHAIKFVIDQAMEHVYPDQKLDPTAQAEVYQFAKLLGLSREDAERVEIRYRKRNGLI